MKPKMPFYEQLTHEEKQLFDSNLQLQHFAWIPVVSVFPCCPTRAGR